MADVLSMPSIHPNSLSEIIAGIEEGESFSILELPQNRGENSIVVAFRFLHAAHDRRFATVRARRGAGSI